MLQVNDWLADLRDGESAEPTGPGHAGPIGPGYAVPASHSHAVPVGHPEPPSYVRAERTAPGYAVPASHGRAGSADGTAGPGVLAGPVAPAAAAAPARIVTPSAPARPAAAAGLVGPAKVTARAVIGDQLRMPIMWCEMGSCISWHADPEALGEADTRSRAVAAGWRIDAFGRLACPRCQQADPGYRPARQVVPRDRYTATARPATIPAGPGRRTTSRSSRDPGRAVTGHPPATRAELEWHHDFPDGEAIPAGGYAEKPAATSDSRGPILSAVRAWRARGGRQAASRQVDEHSEDRTIRQAETLVLPTRRR